APVAPRPARSERRTLHPWLQSTIKRTAGLVITFFVAITVTFVAVLLIPGDPAMLAAGPDATLPQIEAVRQSMGLDRPPFERYLDYLGGALRGDFGTSFSISAPVIDVVMARLPFTLALAGASILL